MLKRKYLIFFARFPKTIEKCCCFLILTFSKKKCWGKCYFFLPVTYALSYKEVSFSIAFPFQQRSAAIATYSVCGFGDVSAIGIFVGMLTKLAPERSEDVSAMAIRAFMLSNIACFLTAAIAGKHTKPYL